jgi:hypothetical protein
MVPEMERTERARCCRAVLAGRTEVSGYRVSVTFVNPRG